jgi:DNA-binding CsgD family transcriptional regulator/biotin operon repressor
MTIISEENYLMHYGILRRSGRYPWGSGGPEVASNRSFLDHVASLQKQGLSEAEIAKGMGINTTQLRAAKSIARNEQKQADINMAQRLKDKGMSNVAIGERMGIPESTVRTLLKPGELDKADILMTTSNMLRDQVTEKKYIDIGSGVESQLGISQTKLSTAVAVLQEEGYVVHYVKVKQLGTGKDTTLKVLSAPDVPYSEVSKNRAQIKQIQSFSEDGGRSYLGVQTPLSVSSKRVGVRYAEDGGTDSDGVIHVRPGVEDISLGGARYAQVRIAVDGTHYLKGMAMYKDDLPDGVDLVFNTNKSRTGNKLDAMKPMKDDPDNPFGAVVRQKIDPRTKKVTSAMNVVNEEGDWDRWSKNLSSQLLSKQSPRLAKEQLDMTFERKQRELEEIMALTNPAVRKKLLESFADDVDSAAVHLKAAALPRQRSNVILPINSLSEKEIYAPNFRDGEKVVLVRYPHGGIFEIPELTVNNRHPSARRALGNALDAVGINSKVAERLSGADFDGDTVLVIPNNKQKIKTAPALEGLKGFDPQRAYPSYEGMKRMSARTKAIEMGQVSNLITDMTIRGATTQELARAVRHSMVVIDAEKHGLNYRQSAIDNGISQLKAKYQGGSKAGASTLVSRATASVRVAERKPRPAAEGGGVDKATGKKMYVPTGATYRDRQGRDVIKTFESRRLAETDDAHTLSSGTPIERVYADHSNRLKTMANQARRVSVNTKTTPYSPSAKRAYESEVNTLRAKLTVAQTNRPLERQAQLLANATVRAKRDANPDMDGAELKKVQSQALAEARARTGAGKQRIDLTDREWAAIQAGAISNNTLSQILANSDLDRIKELATPRTPTLMTNAKSSRAKSMVAAGYTQAEIADALGVSLSTLKTALKEGA